MVKIMNDLLPRIKRIKKLEKLSDSGTKQNVFIDCVEIDSLQSAPQVEVVKIADGFGPFVLEDESRAMKRKGTKDLAYHSANAVPHADVCSSCLVPGGCDDTHPSCKLRVELGLRAEGTAVDQSTAKQRLFASIAKANAEGTLIPVAQDQLF